MTRTFIGVFAACVAFWAGAAAAETLPVSGIYPAGNDTAAALGTIAIEPFGGDDGSQLGIAVADRLRSVTIGGEAYFHVVPAGASTVDAVLQGTADAETSRHNSGTREDKVCVERDEDHDCIKREKREIPCWDQVVRLDAAMRLVGIDGRLIHAFDREDERAQRFCEGDNRPSSAELVRQLAGSYADGLRGELAPVERSEQIRVMETRKGLSKDDGRAFRDAVGLTKNDAEAACAAWSAIGTRNPDNAAVLFNLGLCEESRGELYKAYDLYRRVVAAGDDVDYARLGVQRIEGRWRANAQLEARGAAE